MSVTDMAAARAAAEQELQENGFVREAGGGAWISTKDSIALRVELPKAFPFELPVISVDRRYLGARIPHVEKNGRVCIAATTGVMLDHNRPIGLVQEAVARARAILASGLNGASTDDFFEEFTAYWPSVTRGLLSFCDLGGAPRRIALGMLRDPQPNTDFVAIETKQRLGLLAERTGMEFSGTADAYLIPLQTPVTPPDFDEKSDLAYAIALMRRHATPAHRRIIGRWVYSNNRRLTLVFSFRWGDEAGAACFALRLCERLPAVTPGFRPGRAPFSVLAASHGRQRADRLVTQRADPTFLRARTGSSMDLSNKRVMLVGCGAIGGYLAACLTEAGVGALTLIDPDTLRAENSMRHLLGMADVGRTKVSALKAHLQRKLPQVEVDARAKGIDAVLAEAPEIAAAHDVVVLATGDHTLELRLNRLLRERARLVHVWLESEGVGGHVFVDGYPQKGCLECLFAVDDVHGLYCRASLCAPGKSFTSTIGGCAGTFTPFGSVDAQRAAIESARVTMRLLLGHIPTSVLLTWYQSRAPFDSGILEPSLRARNLTPGTLTEVSSHAGCGACAS